MNINREQLKTLNTKERMYFNIMFAKSGVLYITGKPGVAKSAVARSIASKLGMQYFDIRLSMVDETDIGLYPTISEYTPSGNSGEITFVKTTDEEGKETVKVLDFAIPKWAMRSNEMPTIIHFEELNRASLPVRNAALQLLLERCIGIDFKFNDGVLMLASGNLGEEDGTDVEEFDAALCNRLIHVPHTLSPTEWIESYANENIHPLIVGYIKANPEELYKRSKEDQRAYATPRTWTFLSDQIKAAAELEEFKLTDTERIKSLVSNIGHFYIGNSNIKFVRYIEDTMQLNIHDILNGFDKVADKLKKSNRDKKSELLGNLREMDLRKLYNGEKGKPNQIDNLIKFLGTLDEDELVGYLTYIIDSGMDDDLKKPPFGTILKAFKPLLLKIQSLS
jgi:hypothetical protein